MIEVTLYYQDETLDYIDPPNKILYANNEKEFWELYNDDKDYIKCEDTHGGEYSVHLKKDKIIEIWIEKVIGG